MNFSDKCPNFTSTFLFKCLFNIVSSIIDTLKALVGVQLRKGSLTALLLSPSQHGPVPYCSHLIYNPNKREEAWRYVSYRSAGSMLDIIISNNNACVGSLVHSGLFHVTFNTLVQLVLGIPLEMVHGAWRVAAVYTSGVLAGSLWTSAVKPGVFLSGASGGVSRG